MDYIVFHEQALRIVESYADNSHKPVFRPAPASFVVTLPKMDNSAAAVRKGDISREELVMRAIREKGEITRKDVELILGQSKFAAIQLLNKLLAEGVITKIGSARAIKYRLLTE
ncbi:MAG: hypothetical protein LBK98_00040 [Peptococcaceae bacterium]|jgi:predicted HTH transcriptional regulator|nr:hypothetical protein [Peptococcaceae bacterium]